MSLTTLATYLELTEDDLREMGLEQADLFTDEDKSSGESQDYFNVPDTTPQRVLGKKGWSLGERVDVPASVVTAD